MTQYNPTNQNEINNFHLRNPKPGDYWQEMFCPVCVVIDASEFAVTICETKKDVDDGQYWTWDVSQLKTMSHYDFRKKLCYTSEDLKHKTWCDVLPERHIGFVEEARRLAKEKLNEV